jgi:hypothetical protein
MPSVSWLPCGTVLRAHLIFRINTEEPKSSLDLTRSAGSSGLRHRAIYGASLRHARVIVCETCNNKVTLLYKGSPSSTPLTARASVFRPWQVYLAKELLTL